MKFTLNRNLLKENVYNLLRRAGYHFKEKNESKSELVFVRPLERNGYPRFHLYLKIKRGGSVFNLHLDQKKPVYKGAAAHAAEYKSKVVEAEVERIKKNLFLFYEKPVE